MISLVVWIIVLGLLYWLTTLLPLPEPFPLIVKVLFVIIAILALLSFAGYVAIPGPHWQHP